MQTRPLSDQVGHLGAAASDSQAGATVGGTGVTECPTTSRALGSLPAAADVAARGQY